jgi:hypothetical protein
MGGWKGEYVGHEPHSARLVSGSRWGSRVASLDGHNLV